MTNGKLYKFQVRNGIVKAVEAIDNSNYNRNYSYFSLRDLLRGLEISISECGKFVYEKPIVYGKREVPQSGEEGVWVDYWVEGEDFFDVCQKLECILKENKNV